MLAAVPWKDLQDARMFIEGYTTFLGALERTVHANESVLGGGDAGPAAQAVSSALASLADALKDMEKI